MLVLGLYYIVSNMRRDRSADRLYSFPDQIMMCVGWFVKASLLTIRPPSDAFKTTACLLTIILQFLQGSIQKKNVVLSFNVL